jgi:hypothetical protein
MGLMMRAEHGGRCRDCHYEIEIDEPVYALGCDMWHEDCHVARAHGEGVGQGSALTSYDDDLADAMIATEAEGRLI